jgi:eukaryotic-like serine/threonine-protein kinase
MEPFGPYRLERTINVGSIGQVFLARRDGEKNGAPPIVVKRLHRELARRPAHVQLFLEEGRMARRFRHPNLVHAFDAGTVERPARSERSPEDSAVGTSAGVDHYIAMEWVRGPNLAQRIERGPAPPRAALRIAGDLCSGLSHLHTSGVVHCDVSPTNVLVGPDRVQLTDFGVTNPAGEPQPQVRGTVPYMSPEQARGEPVDGRSDVFAVAAIVWELLAGRPLFHRAQPYLSLAAVVEDPLPPVDAASNPALAALQPALSRALAKLPAERTASCAELAASLAAAALSGASSSP